MVVDQVTALAPPPFIAAVKVITGLLAQIVKLGVRVKLGSGWILITILSVTPAHNPELSIAVKLKVMLDWPKSTGLKLYTTFKELLDGVKIPVPLLVHKYDKLLPVTVPVNAIL